MWQPLQKFEIKLAGLTNSFDCSCIFHTCDYEKTVFFNQNFMYWSSTVKYLCYLEWLQILIEFCHKAVPVITAEKITKRAKVYNLRNLA